MKYAELEFAHRYFSWKRVRGGGIKVIPNEEAILAAQKDFGIFVILSNLHASPWDALRRYRRRNGRQRQARPSALRAGGPVQPPEDPHRHPDSPGRRRAAVIFTAIIPDRNGRMRGTMISA